MSVSVRVPTILRTYTGGESEVSATGTTLAEVLDDLEASFPGIRARILDDNGALRRFVNVYVGDEDVRFLEDLATPTPAGTCSLSGSSSEPSALPTVDSTTPLPWPEERPYRHKRTIEHTVDPATGVATSKVVVEGGRYLFWMQRPRVTVASLRPPELEPGTWPDEVLIEFRTQSPQYAATNLLALTSGDTLRMEARATESRIDARTFVVDHTLTFSLPLAEFLTIIQASEVRLEVGGVAVRLRRDRLEALRDFSLQVRERGRGGA